MATKKEAEDKKSVEIEAMEKKSAESPDLVSGASAEPAAVEGTADADSGEQKAPKAGKASPKKKKFVIIGVVIVVLVVIAAAWFLLPQNSGYRYAIPIDGINYYSNEYVPSEFFAEFQKSKQVFVSPLLVEGAVDPLAANAMNLWLVVLNSKDINAIQLIRVSDGSGQLQYCFTNYGSVKTSEQISKEDCLQTLNDSNKMVVMIGVGRENKVVLSKNNLTITSASNSVMGQVNILVLTQIFPDSNKLIAIANEKIYGIS